MEKISLDLFKNFKLKGQGDRFSVPPIFPKHSPIIDNEIEEYLATKDLNLTTTTNNYKAHKDAEYVIISTPTDYDPDKNYFNTRTVEAVIANVLSINPDAVMVIKSTIPVGYTEKIRGSGQVFCPTKFF